MKILSYLNVSNQSHLEADSGYVFQKSILNELARRGHRVFLIGPCEMPELPPTITPIEIQYSESKYGVRLGFHWEKLRARLKEHIVGVDIILVNQCELSIGLGLLAYELTGKKVPLITYFHYLAVQNVLDGKTIYDPSQNDIQVAPFIWRRQVEAAQYSDANIIGSEFGKQLFMKAIASDCSASPQFHVIPPPVQMRETIQYKSNRIPTILYNHRLYEHYGTRNVFQLLQQISLIQPLRVIVTDPTRQRSDLRHKLDSSVNDLKGYLGTLDFVEFRYYNTQTDYYDALGEIDFGIAPFREGALWSMATADIMAAGKPVIAPRKGAFSEIILDNDLLFDNPDEFLDKVHRLILDIVFREEKGRGALERTRKLQIPEIAKQFEYVFSKVLQNKELTHHEE